MFHVKHPSKDAGGGHGVRVVWNKRLWACDNADCATRTWTERNELVKPRCQLTRWAAAHAVEVLAAVEGSVAGVDRDLVVSWHTVWLAVEPELKRQSHQGGCHRWGGDRDGFRHPPLAAPLHHHRGGHRYMPGGRCLRGPRCW